MEERKVRCPNEECGHENPISRVTCQKCGEKLFARKKKKKQKRAPAKKKAAKKPAKKPAEPKGETKYGRLRALLTSGRKTFAMDELVKESGFDEANVRVAMSILKNSKRTRSPILSDYDREKKVYVIG